MPRKTAAKTTAAPKAKTPIAQSLLAPPPAPVIKNRIVLVLDTSGSMGHIAEKARTAVNAMLRTIREKTVEEGQQTDVAIVTFDSRVDIMSPLTPASRVPDVSHYPVRGSTALFDGVAEGVRAIDGGGEETSNLVLVYTDGDANVSIHHTAESMRSLLTAKQALGNWTFAFQMPPGAGKYFANKYRIPEENVREWEATAKGVEEVERTTTRGITDYFGARSRGQRSVESFYVQPDLSKVTSTQVKRQLDDISDKFKVLEVTREESIQDFVESKTRKPYVIGSAYYQLSKKEKVQPGKKVLLVEKGKKAVWGGNQARELIGLPIDGKTHATVDPLNLSKWEVYIASTSVNRKLVRGTKVLLDVTQTKDLAPTWNHLAAAK